MSSLTLSPRLTLAQVMWPRPASRPIVHDAMLVVCFSLLTGLAAQINIPLPLVPITGQTFAVLLTGALLGPRLGALAMVAYLLEGLAGLPVFAYWHSAWSPSAIPALPTILGPTAGYLISYPFAAGLVGLLASRGWDRKPLPTLAAMLLGSAIIYLFGAGWLAHFIGLRGAILGGVLPFLGGDAVKALAAAALLPAGWKALGRLAS